ncbi:thiamine pyrophosphate-binding protein [Rubripirellula sp.]|nr:thiamine pyrophosphate-binding protein [Rubripirellula sp.]MDB4644840.1 thiamine pyrophosphate-binding protein [Rubripirellula sp.]
MIRVADYIIGRLYDAGAHHLFLVTGRGNLFLSDAVARHKKMSSICTHHEQAASYAAMAYAQQNSSIGACLVSTGCAATNAITGLLCAWQDDVPCVFLSGQNKLAETVRHSGIPIRTFGQQETDIITIVSSITKYAVMLSDPKQVAYEMDKAFYLANEGRRGPVWIDVPLDVQNMRVDPGSLERYAPPAKTSPTPEQPELNAVVELFNRARRPAILIGNGIRSADAVTELATLTESTEVPITTAASAVDVYGVGHKNSIGTVGSLGGTRAGNFVVQNSDLLLVIGCRLSTITTGEEYEKFARHAKIVVVDIDPVEHTKNTVRIDHFIHSDAKAFLSEFNSLPLHKSQNDWVEQCQHWKHIFPRCEPQFKSEGSVDIYHLGEALSHVLPDDAIVVTDSGLTELLIPSTLELRMGQRCLHPASQGAMGYALPAAVGAALASGRDVITCVGDGSIMMNIQELLTISHLKVPVKIFVTNNNMYSVIRTRQEELFRNRSIGTDSSNGVGNPCFKKLADAYELPYKHIPNTTNLREQLQDAISTPGPFLCEVLCVEDQNYIRNSFCHDSRRRVVRRPLEDQAPFMDRNTFLSEMLVDPIDQ